MSEKFELKWDNAEEEDEARFDSMEEAKAEGARLVKAGYTVYLCDEHGVAFATIDENGNAIGV